MRRAQHGAVRDTAGWYYFTHHLIEVAGEEAAVFLDKMFANPIGNLNIGRARYTTMLNEDGRILDDGVVFRLEENKYWYSTLFAQKVIPWFDVHKGEAKVKYRKITDEVDMYAVQGPKSKDLVNSIVEENVDAMKFFSIADNKIGNIKVKIARAGFTGEKLGYEIYVAPKNRAVIEEMLAKNEAAFGAKRVTDVPVMVWTLPAEKGLCLMSDLAWVNPIEAGLDKGISWDKDFIGKEALEKVREEGPKLEILGFTLENDNVHITSRNMSGQASSVMKDGEEIGKVTMFTYGYTIGKSIGYVVVERAKAKIGDKVMIHGNEAVLTERCFV